MDSDRPICNSCHKLISSADNSEAHDSLNLEWRGDGMAIYCCDDCGHTLTRNARDEQPWRSGTSRS